MKKKIIMIILLTVLVFQFGCGVSTNRQGTITKNVFIENGQGSYTRAEIIVPANYKNERIPIVTIGHGFRGNMNSAGAKDLAKSMANSGIGTIRMDYSHYVNASSNEQTNQYTIKTMISDQLLCIKYMIDNFNGDIDRIGIYSRSLGGRVAMQMANENIGGYDYKGMVLVAPAGNKYAFKYYMGGNKEWEKDKKKAKNDGYITHQGVKLTPEFFEEIEDYTPSQYGYKYVKPVLVVYNTLDKVVLPKTSIECANSYPNCKIIKVTSKGGHGYEMNYKQSKLKDMLIKRITSFFVDVFY